MELANRLLAIVFITIGALGAISYFGRLWVEIRSDRIQRGREQRNGI